MNVFCLARLSSTFFILQYGIRSKALQLYLEALDQINNTRQYIRAEAKDAIGEIWQDAKPFVSEFLIDLRLVSLRLVSN